MADRFDELMKSIADQADARVDYAAMHDAILQKAAAEKRRKRTRILRYGAVAATFVVLVGVGSIFLHTGGVDLGAATKASDTPMAAPGAAPGTQEADTASPEDAMNGTAEAYLSPTDAEDAEVPAKGAIPQEAAPAATAAPPQEIEGVGPAACMDMDDCLRGFASEAEAYAHVFTVEELAALCRDARENGGPMDGFEWLYAPIDEPEGYRLVEIAAGERGIAYRFNRAAGAAYNDEYTLYVFGECLAGQQPSLDEDGIYAPAAEEIVEREDALLWAVGDGVACIIPGDGLSLFLPELRPYCALRLVGLGECGTRK